MQHTKVQCTRQRRLDKVQNFLNNTQLVILVSPLHFLSPANSFMELIWVHRLSAACNSGRTFLGAFPNIFGFTNIKNECLTGDRKSTRVNSSHVSISYVVFCLQTKTLIY